MIRNTRIDSDARVHVDCHDLSVAAAGADAVVLCREGNIGYMSLSSLVIPEFQQGANERLRLLNLPAVQSGKVALRVSHYSGQTNSWSVFF